MKKCSITLPGSVAVVCAVGLVTFGAGNADADQWNKKTVLTVSNEPIQIRERVLDPGKYVLKLIDSQSNRNVVQIFNGDESRIIDTVIAIPNYRIQPSGNTRFTFWETPRGAAKAMRAWFYPGDNFGQEFQYPRQLAMLRTAEATPMMVPHPVAAPEPEPAVPGPAATAPEDRPAQADGGAAEGAAAAVPDSRSAPSGNSNQGNASAAGEHATMLPRTATMYPLIGLGGIVALSLYGLLKSQAHG